MHSMTPRRAALLALVLAAIAGLAFITLPYLQGLSLVVRAGNVEGLLRRLADLDRRPVGVRELQIPTPSGALAARVYEPRGARRTVLLVSGAHPFGIDEPRLMRLATDLAASGVTVVTPALPDLSRFVLTPAITDGIQHAAEWLTTQPAFAPDGRVGMMGTSFSGGLSIVAAGRPGLRDRVAYVVSIGGHADLPRVLEYLCTGVEAPPPDSESVLRKLRLKPDASRTRDPLTEPPTPHDYGVALVLLGVADRVVPPAQVEALRAAVRRFLEASALDQVDQAKARAEFAALRDVAKRMPEPSATLLGYVNDRDVAHLGSRLVPHVGAYGDDPALSPARALRKPGAPVFLIHGVEDNVIPAAESAHLAAVLRGVAPVRLLLTTLITHAEAVPRPRFSEVTAAAALWGDLLSR